ERWGKCGDRHERRPADVHHRGVHFTGSPSRARGRRVKPVPTREGEGARPSGRLPGGLLAFLSFVVPGVGQLAARRWIRGSLMLLLTLATIAALVAYERGSSTGSLAGTIVRKDVLIGLLVVNVVVYLLHAACMVDAWRLGRHGSLASALVLAVLLVIAVAPHAALAF